METNPLSTTDQTIATDMLFEAKAAIKDIATAITETTSKEVRDFLTKELKDAINQQERIFNFLQNKGIYHAKNVKDQLDLDIEFANRALGE
ncbi:spore coat protein CotF [Salirhabdus euzebyi]|uniref:Spore coat protein CotF n=1 Tax=Salirhabdus euzebyi TaxID=394506 RepID=A0A841PXE6_9BACI|nr:spore coat protein [Salirhabdus euzebyi]MBB6452694.1 spore coat protein CotF [Salirhabdus euzebyi]